ncbi:hypothetical protein E2K93_17195 [Thalassotalea sp. HSM 43]|uniref:hypothetical protein n=1 Tax=Thalassotalea sp. HSM 43 TaxID=2552945 RepID=UPI0010806749|nr:hypothetical protein [Thalassotalea sp. HSM 43]QBY05993.1 hypothetical protein E2K93_17195 [Thalassotalea sp. HSM 43]
MESTAIEFRYSCLEILKFLSSPIEQVQFASHVEYTDYKCEFVSWWFDDLAMESLPKGTDLINQSFSKSEKLTLCEFTNIFTQNISSEVQSISELLKTYQWQHVIESAKVALDKISVKLI